MYASRNLVENKKTGRLRVLTKMTGRYTEGMIVVVHVESLQKSGRQDEFQYKLTDVTRDCA